MDINKILDPEIKSFVLELINTIEELQQIIKAQKEEIQSLRDEVNRLKGEQGKPDIKASKKKRRNSRIFHQKKKGKR